MQFTVLEALPGDQACIEKFLGRKVQDWPDNALTFRANKLSADQLDSIRHLLSMLDLRWKEKP